MSLINDNNLPVSPSNITTKFREAFETFTNGVNWNLTSGTNDLVQLDGNVGGASYLVISKDPFTQNTETSISTIDTFDAPIELSAGLHLSQRVFGQEFSMELVSDETPLSAVSDLTISSISQSTTTLTVITTTAHNLMPGMRVGIRGVTGDSRLNYPACVVNTIPSSTQFTVTTNTQGTLPSVTSGPFTTGTVYYRPAMGYAVNGFSQIWENTSATNSSVYVRGSGGDVLPSGTIATTHASTSTSTASVTPVTGLGVRSFQPTSEYRFQFQADRIANLDSGIDAGGAQTVRILRTQIVPDASKQYKLRFRATNSKGLSVPNAEIISAVKSASSTATVTTNGNHGLTTGDWIVIHGVRDQTNFLYSATPFQVLSTPTTDTFTASWGLSATATTYGGFVSRINGSVVPGAYQGASIQNVSITTSILNLTGNANWGLTHGDYVNIYGVRVDGTGVSVGIDGVYRVRDISTVNLQLEPIGGTSIPSTLASTNCGGAVIKRTDLRLSFARVFDYTRERVEILPRFDSAGSVGSYVNGGALSTVSTVTTVSTAYLGANQSTTDITSAALTSTATSSAITASALLAHEFNVIVTAVSGTNPTLDVVVQESDDAGTNWYDVYHFPRITATGQYRSPLIPLTGNRVRYVRTVGGTSPSFTNAVNRIQSQVSALVKRQFFNRTIAPNTLNSTTSSYFIDGCKDFNVLVNMGAVTTTAPVIVIEVSPDGTDWVQYGADITTVASTISLVQLTNVLGRFIRLRVKTAGSGATLNYVMIKGVE